MPGFGTVAGGAAGAPEGVGEILLALGELKKMIIYFFFRFSISALSIFLRLAQY